MVGKALGLVYRSTAVFIVIFLLPFLRRRFISLLMLEVWSYVSAMCSIVAFLSLPLASSICEYLQVPFSTLLQVHSSSFEYLRVASNIFEYLRAILIYYILILYTRVPPYIFRVLYKVFFMYFDRQARNRNS